jgi:hypothetical protein
MVLNTDIISTSPYPKGITPYLIQQRGHVSRSVVDLGRMSGESLPLPNDVMTERTTGKYSVIRESVIIPTKPPANSPEDAVELDTVSYVTHDYQVQPDGSFHLRFGNRLKKPEPQHVGEPTRMDLEISYSALTGKYAIKLQRAGQAVAKIELDGLGGIVTLESENVLNLKSKVINLQASTAITANAPNVKLSTAGDLTITKTVKALVDVLAGATSLLKHPHVYTDDGSPRSTFPPTPTG